LKIYLQRCFSPSFGGVGEALFSKIKLNSLKTNGLILFISLFWSFCPGLLAQEIKRVEPICWWEGMKTDLQLMLYGEDLQDCTVSVLEEGLQVKAVHNAENPNYLFVDIVVAKAGDYTIELSKNKRKIKINYKILNRRKDSAGRRGFDSSDVIYLIMPDRFANGDPDNDQINGSIQKLDRNGLEDRHGGDIQGIINHLDYLADLGITTIWSTPLLEDYNYYHQYSISDYYKIDPHLGTNELYKEMVRQAHSKELKVIQDIVPNHCSINHWWMKDLPFNDWVNRIDIYKQSNYALASYSDPHASPFDRDVCAKGWFYDILPDMNLSNPYTMKYLVQMAIWWIEYADLDGLRVDTFFYLGKEGGIWTKYILEEYPNLSLVGEVWGNDPAIVSYWVGSANNYDGFSSHLPYVMDFPLERSIVTGFASDNEAWGGSTKAIYNTLAQDFLYKDPANSQVVFADNHDIDRIYNMLGKDIEKVKMAMTLVTTTRGLPQIYYGTELLFEDDPRGGAHKMRMDFPGGWQNDAIDLFQPENRSPEQQDVFNHIRTLLRFRKKTPVLHTGKLMHYVPKDNVYTYFRYGDNTGEVVMVIINASEKTHLIDWERFNERLRGKETGKEILSKQNIIIGRITEVGPKKSKVIHFR